MRLTQTSLLLATAALTLAACSSNSNSGSGAGGPSVAQKAKSGQYNQAVIDDMKTALAKSEVTLPDTSLLTSQDTDTRTKAQAKLNTQGQQWLQKMQQSCQVQTSGALPKENGQGRLATSISGNGCPLTMTSTQDQTNNFSDHGGSMGMHLVTTETIVDPDLAQESSSRSLNMDLSMQADFADSGASHMTGSGSLDADIITSKIHVDFQMETSMTADHQQSVAMAMQISSEKGRSDFGMVADANGTHYYMGGTEVTADEFNKTVGALNPTMQTSSNN